MKTITLNTPILHNGEEVSELNLDLDGLTGDALIQAETEHAMVHGNLTNVPELSKSYLIHVAAKAAKMPVDDLKQLKAKDFSKVTMEVQNFLLE